MKRRVLIGGAMAAGVAAGLPIASAAPEKTGKAVRAVAKVDDGSVVNVPLAKRTGPKSVVYFTRWSISLVICQLTACARSLPRFLPFSPARWL